MAPCISLVGFDILVRIALNAVPAWLDLIPELAIVPSAIDKSSQLNPKAPAKGAAYLKESPIIPTLVLLLVAVAANTSAK